MYNNQIVRVITILITSVLVNVVHAGRGGSEFPAISFVGAPPLIAAGIIKKNPVLLLFGGTLAYEGSNTMAEIDNLNESKRNEIILQESKLYLNELNRGLNSYIKNPNSSMNISVTDILSEFESNDIIQDYVENAKELSRLMKIIKLAYAKGDELDITKILSSKYYNESSDNLVSLIMYFTSNVYQDCGVTKVCSTY